MDNYFDIIKKCPLFYGIAEKEIGGLLKCLLAYQQKFEKNNFICSCYSRRFLGKPHYYGGDW